jgi:asparagine N-glycosylation enzyme membrane subunit Stt3
MGTADFKYYGYGHGALFSMVLFFAYGVLFLFEIIFGLIRSKQDFFFQYVSNPRMIFLTAHFVVIFFSAASIALTYFIGKKLFNNKVGLIASLLFSLSFINIQMSSLIKEDSLALSMLLLGCYFAASILMSDNRPVKLWFVLAGFFMGLAAAAKYTFIIGFIFVIAAYFLKNRKEMKLK